MVIQSLVLKHLRHLCSCHSHVPGVSWVFSAFSMSFHHSLLDLSYSHVLYLATLQIRKSSAHGKHYLYVFCAWLIKLRYLMNTILKNIFN